MIQELKIHTPITKNSDIVEMMQHITAHNILNHLRSVSVKEMLKELEWGNFTTMLVERQANND